MKKGTIIFSIDDGRRDLYELAKEILIPLKIPATLNITTSGEYVSDIESIKKEELIEIVKSGLFEIANHSHMHTNETEDIKKGHKNICQWFGFDENLPMGFASPGSALSVEEAEKRKDELKALGIKYVRTSTEDHFNTDRVFALSSFAITFDIPLDLLKSLADEAADKGCCLIYLFHSVFKKEDKDYKDTWSYDYDDFKELVLYVRELEKAGKADIMTTENYVQLMEKR